MAGELIRILINHPDVELVAAHAPALKGKSVSSVHHGLTGECTLAFTDTLDVSALDVLFLDSHSETAERLRSRCAEDQSVGSEESRPQKKERLKIIDMSHAPALDFESLGMVYGLSEINRKKLVREAVSAVVPRSVAGVSLISLAPLARNMLLNSEIAIRVECPDDIGVSDKMERARRELTHMLSELQLSYNSDVTLTRVPSSHSARALRIEIETECPVTLPQLQSLYDETYADHNFTFITTRPMPPQEVEGTDKCLVCLSKPSEDRLLIEAVADCRMRGGAGDAVHIMNLMFGLHEKTGLALKAHKY